MAPRPSPAILGDSGAQAGQLPRRARFPQFQLDRPRDPQAVEDYVKWLIGTRPNEAFVTGTWISNIA